MKWTPERLRRLREALELSLADMGRHFDVRGDTVRNWESGRHVPHEMHFAKFEELERQVKERKRGKR